MTKKVTLCFLILFNDAVCHLKYCKVQQKYRMCVCIRGRQKHVLGEDSVNLQERALHSFRSEHLRTFLGFPVTIVAIF